MHKIKSKFMARLTFEVNEANQFRVNCLPESKEAIEINGQTIEVDIFSEIIEFAIRSNILGEIKDHLDCPLSC